MIKVGVIGVGSMGQHHARIYSSMNEVKLIGITDVEEKRAEELALRYRTKAYKDYRELLKQDLDAVSIAVPTSLHEKIALDAIEYNCNVLIEKPITHTIKSAKRVIIVAERHDVKLMVGHVERFNPIVPVIMREIENDNVILLEITRVGPLPPRVKDVGVVVDLAIHDIDLIRYLSNCEPKVIRSVVSRSLSDKEDSAILLFEMEKGTIARLTANWLTPFKVRKITVATERKFIEGDFITQKVTEYSRYSEDGSYVTKGVNVPYAEPLGLELEAFIDAIKNGTVPPVTGEDGLRALEIALTALELAYKRKEC